METTKKTDDWAEMSDDQEEVENVPEQKAEDEKKEEEVPEESKKEEKPKKK